MDIMNRVVRFIFNVGAAVLISVIISASEMTPGLWVGVLSLFAAFVAVNHLIVSHSKED